MSTRVVVTGYGVVSPLGQGAARNWERIKRGESGVRTITRFDTSTMDVHIAGEVLPLPAVPEDEAAKSLGLHSRFALVAGREAWMDSGLADHAPDPNRVGVFLGSGKGISDPSYLVEPVKAAMPVSDFSIPKFLSVVSGTMTNHRRYQESYFHSASYLANAVDARGPNWVGITACAAGNHAIGEAFRALRHGDADVILAGGTHSQVDMLSLAGYGTLGALSTRNDAPEKASRPFDLKRDGFILGEGAAVLVLETLEHAKKRGADIRAEIVGYGNTADAYRVTDPRPDGIAAEQAMRNALKSAGLEPGDIDYINAHGTSTHQNDAMECGAITRIFGPKGAAPPVSSTKSMIGHLIAAAGAVEAFACIRALQEGLLPPTVNYENPDPACDLDFVPNEARSGDIRYAMNNSFGFGGQNIVTILRRYAD